MLAKKALTPKSEVRLSALNEMFGECQSLSLPLWASAKYRQGKQSPERCICLRAVGNISSLALCLAR